MFIIHIQQYYRRSDGALLFVDLQEFKNPDNRQYIILSAKRIFQVLEQNIGIKIPCVLVGAKVRAYIHDKIMIAINYFAMFFYDCDYD